VTRANPSNIGPASLAATRGVLANQILDPSRLAKHRLSWHYEQERQRSKGCFPLGVYVRRQYVWASGAECLKQPHSTQSGPRPPLPLSDPRTSFAEDNEITGRRCLRVSN
jgi:hypothetical protein